MGSGLISVQSEKPIQFRVDRPLGKLLKWLRLLGYDAISDHLPKNGYLGTASFDDNRIWITCNKPTVPVEGIMVINPGNLIDQLRQIIVALRIPRQSLKPFSRCSECNAELKTVAREKIRGRVPDYVWETQLQFRTCDACQKIFWSGTHVDKQRQMIDQLFE